MAMTENLDRWKARCDAIPGAIHTQMQAALDANADEFISRLQTNVPKESGDLASTIKKTSGGKELSVTVSIGSPEHPYAAAVEFGHMDHGVHVPPKPFFYPLLRVLKKKFRSRMSRAIRVAVAKYAQSSDGTGITE